MCLPIQYQFNTLPAYNVGGGNMKIASNNPTLSFPSPPASDPGLEFDNIDCSSSSFNHSSSPDTSVSSTTLEDAFAWDFDLSSLPLPPNFSLPTITEGSKLISEVSPTLTAPTPTSTTIISPKSSISSFADVGGPFSSSNPPSAVPGGGLGQTDADTAEALSNHHLQRYLHYKTLAAQAEAEAKATLALQQQQQQQQVLSASSSPPFGSIDTNSFNSFEALLASYSTLPMPTDNFKPQEDTSNMIAFQNQPSHNPFDQNQIYLAYNPHQQASMAHAQAQAHLQAHDMAAARAQQHRMQSQMDSTTYWVDSTQSALPFMQQSQPSFSRTSLSTQSASPPFPSTPIYAPVPSMMAPAPSVITAPSLVNTSLPTQVHPSSAPESSVSALPSVPSSAAHSPEGEDEMEDDDDNHSTSGSSSVPNSHGGGRGYIPGKTPDDPKKKHKCHVCGRGFARAFNLKSHVQTHNPIRSKPYQCPHSTCKRGFSRLHDLERHRQGIHSDGPLVEAKRKGITPSVARAQGRIQKRVETGSLV